MEDKKYLNQILVDGQKQFNLTTHVRHPKSGQIIGLNPYKLVVSRNEDGSSTWLFERPVGSGLWYYSNGEMDKEKSKEGLEKIKREERERSKTALQKAQDAHEKAKADLAAAEKAHKEEMSRRKSEEKPEEK